MTATATPPWQFYKPEGSPGPFTTAVIAPALDVHGFTNIDDLAHFHLILATQRVAGVGGDLLEIGSYFGRAATLLARHLAHTETLVLCDLFDLPATDAYARVPTPDAVRRTVAHANPDLRDDQLEIHRCRSADLPLDPDRRFRFVHVDGDHSPQGAEHDLRLAWRHLAPAGIIAVDDYHHPRWPGVTTGVDAFLDDHPDAAILADLNRHGAAGRKLYLTRHAP